MGRRRRAQNAMQPRKHDRFEGWLGKPVFALLVRGRHTRGHFLVPSPEKERGAAEIERHERVYRCHRENYPEQTKWHARRSAAA
jgi:hypothetical protein